MVKFHYQANGILIIIWIYNLCKPVRQLTDL